MTRNQSGNSNNGPPAGLSIDAEWSFIFRSAVESAYDAVLITDAELTAPGPHILYVNKAFTEMTGWSAEEIIGQSPRILQGPETDPEVLTRLRRALEHGESFDARAINYRRDGSAFQLEWRTAPIPDAEDRITHYISIQRDVTAEERIRSRLQQRADFDDLTGVLRRASAEQAIQGEIKRAGRYGTPFSLILFDIDHFRTINDEHGHAAADEVLKQLTRVITTRLREHDHFARWGGDEFLLVLPHTSSDGAEPLAQALHARAANATFVDHITITLSMGIAEYAEGDTPQQLIERADEGLYAAREAGRNSLGTG